MNVAKRTNKKGKITTKRVQVMEETPYIPSHLDVKAEDDTEEDTDSDGLTFRRRAFVDAITGPAFGNATKAARIAGYSDSNRRVLENTASFLLGILGVQRAIRNRLADAQMGAEDTRRAIAAYASADMSAFVTVDEDGEPQIDWKKAAAAGHIGDVKEIREEGIKGDGTFDVVKRTFKLRDPMPALALLAKMHGLVKDIPQGGVTVNVYQMSDDDLVRIATSGGEGSAEAAPGEAVADRLRQCH